MSSGQKIEISTELLRTLHRVHRQRTDLTNQLERGPRQIKASEAIVSQARAEAERAREALKNARLASDEKQLQLQTREARIEDLKAKLNAAASNREFATFKEQIAADEQANSVQSDEIFESLEQLDVLAQKLKEADIALEKHLEEHQSRVDEVQKRMVIVREDLERVEKELAESESKIPVSVKDDYDRVTASKGEDALAPIDGESCGGCYQTLTTQVMNRLQLSQLVRCPNCNAFIYLPEDRRVS